MTEIRAELFDHLILKSRRLIRGRVWSFQPIEGEDNVHDLTKIVGVLKNDPTNKIYLDIGVVTEMINQAQNIREIMERLSIINNT